MSFSHLPSTPEAKGKRRESTLIRSMVPLQPPSLATSNFTPTYAAATFSTPTSSRHPHFEETRPLRPNAPNPWSHPRLEDPSGPFTRCGPRASISPTLSQFQGVGFQSLIEKELPETPFEEEPHLEASSHHSS